MRILYYLLFSTDHKSVGWRYISMAGIVFYILFAVAFVSRLELMEPGLQYFKNVAYQSGFLTLFRELQIYLLALPGLTGGIGNLVIPKLTKQAQTAYPRLNMLVFWLLPLAVLVLILPSFGPETQKVPPKSWVTYPPTEASPPMTAIGVDIAVGLGFLITVFNVINLAATIFGKRNTT